MSFLIDVPEFTWEDLHRKNLNIRVGVSYDDFHNEKAIVVIGYDMDTGHVYTLHTKTEKWNKEVLK